MKHRFGSVEVDYLGHASVKLQDSEGKTVYLDPWNEVMEEDLPPADIIVSTHDHFDHFDPEAIHRLSDEDTVLVLTEESLDEAPEDIEKKIMEPGESVKASGITFRGIEAYNTNKFRSEGEPFHPKGLCTGVVLDFGGKRFYHASDTDPIEEMSDLSNDEIDVAFIPIGGHYTMDQDEALEAVSLVRPATVVPIHYNVVDNTEADAEKFREDVERETSSEVVILR